MPPRSSAFPKIIMLRSRETLDCEKLCGVRYPWISNQQTRSEAVVAWGKLVGQKIQVLDIPGNHFEAFAAKNVSAHRDPVCCPWLESWLQESGRVKAD